MRLLTCAFACVLALPALADEDISDQYPGSPLYSKPVEVIPHIWSAIGATAPPGYENAGHNNNLSFIVTGDGVVVVNGGAAYILAKALHDEIKSITDQPVKLVINENGQGQNCEEENENRNAVSRLCCRCFRQFIGWNICGENKQAHAFVSCGSVEANDASGGRSSSSRIRE